MVRTTTPWQRRDTTTLANIKLEFAIARAQANPESKMIISYMPKARCITAWLSDVCQQLMLQRPHDHKFRLVCSCVCLVSEPLLLATSMRRPQLHTKYNL